MATRAMTETAVFLEEIAVSQTPKRLAGLMRVLEAQGAHKVSPSERAGLHPLLIPLSAKAEAVTCLLRWPEPSQHKNMPLPVVSQTRGSLSVQLIARSVDEYLHRLLVEEDVAAGGAAGQRPLAAAAGPDAEGLYRAGDMEAAGMGGKLPMYLIRKVGMFPDVCESLAAGHLLRNDQTSAMVASEWYMRSNHFPGWGRPYEYAAELFGQLKRHEEARDFARVALRLPWWTLRAPLAEVQAVAQLEGDADRVMYLLSEEAAAAASATVNKFNYKQPKTTQQLALERAAALMNKAAAGALPSYVAIRSDLAAAYREAGLSDVANFINAA